MSFLNNSPTQQQPNGEPTGEGGGATRRGGAEEQQLALPQSMRSVSPWPPLLSTGTEEFTWTAAPQQMPLQSEGEQCCASSSLLPQQSCTTTAMHENQCSTDAGQNVARVEPTAEGPTAEIQQMQRPQPGAMVQPMIQLQQQTQHGSIQHYPPSAGFGADFVPATLGASGGGTQPSSMQIPPTGTQHASASGNSVGIMPDVAADMSSVAPSSGAPLQQVFAPVLPQQLQMQQVQQQQGIASCGVGSVQVTSNTMMQQPCSFVAAATATNVQAASNPAEVAFATAAPNTNLLPPFVGSGTERSPSNTGSARMTVPPAFQNALLHPQIQGQPMQAPTPVALAGLQQQMQSMPTLMLLLMQQQQMNYPPTFTIPSTGTSAGQTCNVTSSNAAVAAAAAGPQAMPRQNHNHRGKASKTTKAARDDDQPKRALTAYNIFFREERERLLVERRGHRQQQQAAMMMIPTNNVAETTTATTNKRKRREPAHGVGFEEMAKTIAQRWKSLKGEALAEYQQKAMQDKVRYKREMEVYKQSKAHS